MEQAYWIGRMDAAVALAHGAPTAEARLEHYEQAGRCSVKAVRRAPLPLPPRAPLRIVYPDARPL